jgi:hypothetical protein
MRIYEGAPRQNYEDILRSIGAILDERGMREITLAETDDGFMVQGLAVSPGEDRPWDDPQARQAKETFYLGDDDIARLMDESVARRKQNAADSDAPRHNAGFYEMALRVIGGYVDQQQPRDVFFFEQEHQFVMRLLTQTRAGLRHVLVEFTRDEIDAMVTASQREHP